MPSRNQHAARLVIGLLRWLAIAYLSLLLLMTFIERWLVYPAPPVAAGEWSPPGDDYDEIWITVPPVGNQKAPTQVHGWFFDRAGADHVVVYCHGNGADIAALPELARRLRDELNAAVLVFDYRGYGKSEGKPFEAGVVADGLAAHRWLSERKGRPLSEVVLIGRSLGGGVATAVAAEQGAAALVLESTFTRLTDAAASHYPWLPVRWLMQNRFDSVSRIADYHGPVLVSHGTADGVVPFEQGERLHDAAIGPKRFIRLADRGHNGPRPASYYEELRGFLSDSLTRD